MFCPFLWDGNTRFGGPKPEGREYHDASGDAVIDFRLDDETGDDQDAIKAQIKLEVSAERLRLIYVALTRAVYRCYLIAGTYTTNSFGTQYIGEHEEPAQLAGRRRPGIAEELVRREADAGRLSMPHGKPWPRRLAPHLGLDPLPAQPGTPVTLAGPAPETLSALPPPKTIAPAWRFSSFSGITNDAKSESAANDHDAHIAGVAKSIGAPPPDIAPDDILRFPRGPSAGTCLHAMFDRIDFTSPAGWNDGIARSLFAHPQFLPGRERDRAVGAPHRHGLADADGRDEHEAARRHRARVRSHHPAPHRTRIQPAFAARVSRHAQRRAQGLGYDVPRLTFRDIEGYLKGFIDLVFEHRGRYYVIDWKSNHLGYAPSDYGPAELQAAMAEHSYHLQYLLYSLAVAPLSQAPRAGLPPRDAFRRRVLPFRARRAAALGQCRRHPGGGVPPSAIGGDAGAPRRAVHRSAREGCAMSAAPIQMPEQALAEGFAHHVMHWAQECNAPDHTLAALAAAARATSLATTSGHVCTYLADIAAADNLDEDVLRKALLESGMVGTPAGARYAPADPRRRWPHLPAPLFRLRAPVGAATDGAFAWPAKRHRQRTSRPCSTACSPRTPNASAIAPTGRRSRPPWRSSGR